MPRCWYYRKLNNRFNCTHKGGVAPVPYRAAKAEDLLKGCEIDEELSEKAGFAAGEGAKPYKANVYKVQLIKTLVKRELLAL